MSYPEPSILTAPHSTFNKVNGPQINNKFDGNPTTFIQNIQPPAAGHSHELQEFANWLSPINFRQTQSDISGSRREGTGDWLVEDETFREWQSGNAKTLWCTGIPGAGKTFLASRIIDHLEQKATDNIAVLYIYCNYKDQGRQTVDNLVAGLLKQLVEDFLPIFDRVKNRFSSHQRRQSRPTLQELHSTLTAEIKTLSQVFIVVDALDEIPENDDRSELIYRLQSLGSNLLVTSRDIELIGKAMQGVQRMQIHAHESDMRKYIEGRIRPGTRLDSLIAGDPPLREKICERIIENTRGMFLLSRLHMDSLVSKTTRREIRIALDNLPKGVESAYDETMNRINGLDKNHRILASNALIWITCAYRPMSFEELQHAIALSCGAVEISNDDLVDISVIMDVCAGLVVADGEKEVLRLVHYTAQEYFSKYKNWSLLDSHAKIARVCLQVLSLPLPADWPYSGGLYLYAARYWGCHARGTIEETDASMICDFLRRGEKVELAWACMHGSRLRNRGTALHLCAFFGLARTIGHLLENNVVVDREEASATPPHIAAERSHVKVVSLLRDRGGDINARDDFGFTPLLIAMENGQVEIIKLLLAKDELAINQKDRFGQTPLAIAAQKGEFALVKLLLERHDVNVNSKDIVGWTPIFHAICGGSVEVSSLMLAQELHLRCGDDEPPLPLIVESRDGRTSPSSAAQRGETVKILLEKPGIDLNSKDRYNRTPLLLATEVGQADVVKLLLDSNNVDVNSRDINGFTPLSFATKRGNVEMVQLLLEKHDVDVTSKNNYGQAPLLFAAEEGNVEVVKLLLKNGDVGVNSKDRLGATPLSLAARRGNIEVVKLLLSRHDVVVDSKDNDGHTPLSLAAMEEKADIVKMLLERDGIDINIKDQCGNTPLLLAMRRLQREEVRWPSENHAVERLNHWKNFISKGKGGQATQSHAISWGDSEVVKMLLSRHGVAVDSKNNDGHTPLSLAARGGKVDIVKMLLSRHGVVADSKDNDGQTPLSLAARWGNTEVAKVLLSRHDVAVNSKDNDGHTPLSLAAKEGEVEIVRMFLERDDVDINIKDQCGNTPLLLAIRWGRTEVVELLLENRDTVVELTNEDGQTPLSSASEQGNAKVVQLLLARPNVSVSSKGKDGQTPLSLAAKYGNAEVVRMLLARHEVDVNSTDKDGKTPISFAAEGWHVEVVQLLLTRREMDINSKTNDGSTPLSLAVRTLKRGQRWRRGFVSKIVVLLLSIDDVDVNSQDNQGTTPLMIAASCNADEDADIVGLFCIHRGRDIKINLKDNKGWTALIHAAATLKASAERVKLLLAYSDIEVDAKDDNGWTALMHAVNLGCIPVVEQLLQRSDVDVNSRDKDGVTPLMRASFGGRSQILHLLLSHEDISVNLKSNNGLTPLMYASAFGAIHSMRKLLSRPGVEVNARDDYSNTALTLAAAFKKVSAVECLLSRDGVDVDLPGRKPLMREENNFRRKKDGSIYTLLTLANKYDHKSAVEMLLALDNTGTNVEPMEGTIPPLWAAASRVVNDVGDASGGSDDAHRVSDNTDGQREFSEFFEDNSVNDISQDLETERVLGLLLGRTNLDVNWRNQYEQTLLLVTAGIGRQFLVKQLLARDDIDVNLQDRNGDSPLHCAARRGHKTVASLLVVHDGIALNLKNAWGQTPLHCAIAFKLEDGDEENVSEDASPSTREALVKLLLAQNDIRIDLEDDNGLTPLMLAQSVEAAEVVRLLEQWHQSEPEVIRGQHTIYWESQIEIPHEVSSDGAPESYHSLDEVSEDSDSSWHSAVSYET